MKIPLVGRLVILRAHSTRFSVRESPAAGVLTDRRWRSCRREFARVASGSMLGRRPFRFRLRGRFAVALAIVALTCMQRPVALADVPTGAHASLPSLDSFV